MTKEETQKVRLAAKSLLKRLLREPPPVLIQDWFKDSQSKERVKTTVQEVLNNYLPESYDRACLRRNATPFLS
jgi:type I restriction enzyme R subunit